MKENIHLLVVDLTNEGIQNVRAKVIPHFTEK